MDPGYVRCDSCGSIVHWSQLVETIEEYLCEQCASGIGPDGEQWYPEDEENEYDDEM